MGERIIDGGRFSHVNGTYGDSAETTHKTRSEAHPDALAAAGDQAAADVDARAGGSAEPGSRRKPHARRGADRGPSADRGGGTDRENRGRGEGKRGRLGR